MNTKKLYRQLLVSVLLRADVVEVVCNSDKVHYFDRLVVSQDGGIEVHYDGLKEAYSHLYLESDLSYAKLLYYIEEDLRAVKIGSIPKHGYSFKFHPETELRIMVWGILLSNGMNFPISVINSSSVEIEVCDGDWKHDHLSLLRIMESNGFILMEKRVTAEDGSDCYSAVYTYKKLVEKNKVE